MTLDLNALWVQKDNEITEAIESYLEYIIPHTRSIGGDLRAILLEEDEGFTLKDLEAWLKDNGYKFTLLNEKISLDLSE